MKKKIATRPLSGFDELDAAGIGAGYRAFEEEQPVAEAPKEKSTSLGDYSNAAGSGVLKGIAGTATGIGTFAQAPAANTLSGVLGARALVDRGVTGVRNWINPGSSALDEDVQSNARMASQFAAEERAKNSADGGIAGAAKSVEGFGRASTQALKDFDENYNPELIKQEKNVSDAKGFWGTAKATLSNPLALTGSLAQSAPDMALGVGVGSLAARSRMALGLGAVEKAGAAAAKTVAASGGDLVAQGVAANAARDAAAQALQKSATHVAGSVGVVSESASSAYGGREGTYQQVMGMPEQTLLKTPRYNAILAATGDPAKARMQFANEIADQAPMLTALGTALGSMAITKITGHDLTAELAAGAKKTTAKDIAVNALGHEGPEEVLQGIPEDLVQHGAMVQADPDHELDLGGGIAQNYIAGAVMGAGGTGASYVKDKFGKQAPVDPAAAAAKLLADQQEAARKAAVGAAHAAALTPNSPISRAAAAANPQADPAKRLAELKSISNGTADQVVTGFDGKKIVIPGRHGRFFTAAEKEEYDTLKAAGGAQKVQSAVGQQLTPEEAWAKAQELDAKAALDEANGVDAGGSVADGMGVVPAVNAPAPNMGLPTAEQIEADQLANPDAYGPSLQQPAFDAQAAQAQYRADTLAAQQAQDDELNAQAEAALAKMAQRKQQTRPVNEVVSDGGYLYEGTQDGDVLNGLGKPFTIKMGALQEAKRQARESGGDWTVAPVFDGFVARKKERNHAPDQAGPAQAATETVASKNAIKPGDWIKPAEGDDQRPRQVDSVGDDGWVYTKSGDAFKPEQVIATEKPTATPVTGGTGVVGNWEIPLNQAQAPVNTAQAATETIAPGDVERYQWQRNAEGGQERGNQQTIQPLTEALFNEYIAPKVAVKSYRDYQQQFPAATHISLVQKADGSVELGAGGVGPIDKLRPSAAPVEKGWVKAVDSFDSPEAVAHGSSADSASQTKSLAGEPIDKEWTAFHPESGTLNVPRADMPQIKSENRGALVNFLKARGIDSTHEEVPTESLKPTQTEYSPEKVEKAKGYKDGDRSILVSSDGHVLDGHHQWVAKHEAGEPVKVIRLDAPIDALLSAVREFPSAETAVNSTTQESSNEKAPETQQESAKPEATASAEPVNTPESGEPAADPAGASPSEVDLTTVEGVARAVQLKVAANRRKSREKSREEREAKGYAPNSTPESEKVDYEAEIAAEPSDMQKKSAAAMLGTDPLPLIGMFVNGNFEASEDVFKAITGVKIRGLSAAAKKAALYQWAGWTPEQIAQAEGDVQARKDEAAEKYRQDDLKSAVTGAWLGLDRLKVNLKSGDTITGQDFVLQSVAGGFDKAHSQKKGAAVIYGLTDGSRFTTLKAREFTAFVKSAIAFGGLDKALAYVNPPKPQAPEGFVDRSIDIGGVKDDGMTAKAFSKPDAQLPVEDAAPAPQVDAPSAEPVPRPKNWENNYGAASKVAEAMGIALRGANGKMKKVPELVAEIKALDVHNSGMEKLAADWAAQDADLSKNQPKVDTSAEPVQKPAESEQATPNPVSERKSRIASALDNGGHVVGSELRDRNGLRLLILTPEELADMPGDKIRTKPDANMARTQSSASEPVDAPQIEWTRTRNVDRMGIALKAGFKEAVAESLSKRGWNSLDVVVQEKLAEAMAEQAAPSSDPAERVSTTHAGLKIYPVRVNIGGDPADRWGVQTLNNAEREKNGERQIGGDPLAETLEQAKELAEQEVATAKTLEKHREELQRVEQEKSNKDAAEKTAFDESPVGRFIAASDYTPMRKGAATLALKKLIGFNGASVETHQFIESLVADGYAPTLETENRIADKSRREWNRMDDRQQREHERKVKNGGTVEMAYMVNGDSQYSIGKTEYAYAKFLHGSESIATGAPTIEEVKAEKPKDDDRAWEQAGMDGVMHTRNSGPVFEWKYANYWMGGKEQDFPGTYVLPESKFYNKTIANALPKDVLAFIQDKVRERMAWYEKEFGVIASKDDALAPASTKPEPSKLIQAMNFLMELEAKLESQGRVADDRLVQMIRQQKAVVKELEAEQETPSQTPSNTIKSSPSEDAAIEAKTTIEQLDAQIKRHEELLGCLG